MNEASKPVCAVVGVGPGNGAAFARRFSAAGYSTALLARRTDFTGTLASSLPDARAYACDVGDAASVAAAFDGIRRELGEVDVLVYNAGSGVWGTIDDVSATIGGQSTTVQFAGLIAPGLFQINVVIPAIRAGNQPIVIVSNSVPSPMGVSIPICSK